MQICNPTADLHKFWNVLDVVFSYLCERRCGISNEIVLVVIHCLREFFFVTLQWNLIIRNL